jgi:uncharacterized protein (DUF1697 family)
MALVVFLRGINVGGHRAFRPSVLAKQLEHLDVVNIGAAGTLVIRRAVTRARLRAELQRRLPFDAEIFICQGREIVGLVSQNFFDGYPVRPDVVRFVSVLSRRTRVVPQLPVSLPSRGTWLLRVLARDDRFVVGVYRRHMKVIGCLGALDRVFGVPVTTRSWTTMTAVAEMCRTTARPRRQAGSGSKSTATGRTGVRVSPRERRGACGAPRAPAYAKGSGE